LRVVRFGVFELDLDSGDLRKNGREVRLVGQPMQILCLLIERRGEVVTREELRNALWGGDTFVDFDVSLSSAVKKLRDALGDSADSPRFVQTLPRRGYRFIAPVEPVTNGEPIAPIEEPPRKRGWLAALAVGGSLAFMGLWWQSSSRASKPAQPAPIRSIAVLPFDNLTGDPSQEYLVDGITDGLTTELAELHGLRVISRTSVMRYRKTTKRLPDIARELNVDAIVEGSIMRTDQQLQISAQLIDASNDRHIWAHKYSGTLREAIDLENAIAESIATAVGLPVLAQKHTLRMNPDAFDAYLKGMFAAGRQNLDGFRSAVTYFEAAIASQPDCALCYAWLAQQQWQLAYSSQPPTQVVLKAEAAARKAIELDPSIALAHRVLGNILHTYYWRWDDGDRELKQARELEPNSAETHRGLANQLIRSGRYDEAMVEIERVHSLDPSSTQTLLDAASAFRGAGQYDRSLTTLRKALTADPSLARSHFQLALTYIAMNRLHDAIPELEAAERIGSNARFKAYLATAYAMAGRQPEARKILGELEAKSKKQYVSAFGFAQIYDALGDGPHAMEALEKAYHDHAIELAQWNQYSQFRTIASDPRYQMLKQRVQRPPREPVAASLAR
jgi:TolB-like protein/DNA-binding winged helix-turn-helix (wHTH) protein/Tfp pilus assembly protein PilF